MTKNKPESGHAAGILLIALAIVILLSLLPWSRLTSNVFKDFNVFEDLAVEKTQYETDELVDPMLISALEESPATEVIPEKSIVSQEDEAVAEASEENPLAVQEEKMPQVESAGAFEVPRDGEIVMIEDYTPSGSGLVNLRNALSRSDSRPVRIAMIGDSYIEGDVFSQNIRANLQQSYGGRGVGYMAMHSEIPGFRQSVRQTDSGWTGYDIRQSKKPNCRWLAGEYFSGGAGAKSTFKGVSKIPQADAWNSTKFLFIAPASGSIKIETDSGVEEVEVEASENVQCIDVPGETAKASITNSIPGLMALGVWLNDNSGVTLDCMSLRGNSGITHRNLSRELVEEMRRHIDYDLIIVEYGINALSSGQKDYSRYGSIMQQVVAGLKTCYPNADILLMGIGDRGQKAGTSVHSISTAQNMVDAQREAARKAGVMFWDTRQAMGGEDAVVDWKQRKLVNADYIHLNHNGGEVLAKKFTDAINRNLSK